MGSASIPSLHLPTFFAKVHTQERSLDNGQRSLDNGQGSAAESQGSIFGSRRYFFRPACQFSITVYGSGPLLLGSILGAATRKRRPSAVQSHVASPAENPRG